MNISLRLYRMHDLDLMILKTRKGVNFSRIIKTSLSSFVKKELFVIDLSEQLKDNKESVEPKTLPYISFQMIKFDENKDKEVIKLLKSIKDGYRNNFIKNVVRLYLSSSLLSLYSNSETIDFPVLHEDMRSLKSKSKKNIEKTVKEDLEVKIEEKNIEEKKIEEVKENILLSKEGLKTEKEEKEEKEIKTIETTKIDEEKSTEALNFFMSMM